MLLPIKPICKKSDARRDGTSVIYIQYCFSSDKRTTVDTGIAIPATHWKIKQLCIGNDLPSAYGDAASLNEQLLKAVRIAEDIVAFAIKKKLADPLKFLKQTLKPDCKLPLF